MTEDAYDATRATSLWHEVLEHAGQDPDRFFLLEVPGQAEPNGRRAAFYHAGPVLQDDPEDILHGEQLALANTQHVRARHRIAAFTDIDWDNVEQEAVLAGLLRHEIRHAEQFDALGEEFFELYDLALLVAGWKVGGLPGGASLYGLIPAEMDANTAAAQFLRDRRPNAVPAVLAGDDGQLARSNTGPGPLADLPAKTVAFLYLLREIADDPARSPAGLTFEDRLRHVNARAASTWAALASA